MDRSRYLARVFKDANPKPYLPWILSYMLVIALHELLSAKRQKHQ